MRVGGRDGPEGVPARRLALWGHTWFYGGIAVVAHVLVWAWRPWL